MHRNPATNNIALEEGTDLEQLEGAQRTKKLNNEEVMELGTLVTLVRGKATAKPELAKPGDWTELVWSSNPIR